MARTEQGQKKQESGGTRKREEAGILKQRSAEHLAKRDEKLGNGGGRRESLGRGIVRPELEYQVLCGEFRGRAPDPENGKADDHGREALGHSKAHG